MWHPGIKPFVRSRQVTDGTYRRVEPSKQALFDLGQNPNERPRICLPGFPLFTLTAQTSCIWSPSLGRMLTINEIATGQGLPCTPTVAGALGMPVLELAHLARTAACRLIGNGMTLCCVGAVTLWALRWLKFDHGPAPRGVKANEAHEVSSHFIFEPVDVTSKPPPSAPATSASEATSRATASSTEYRSAPPLCCVSTPTPIRPSPLDLSIASGSSGQEAFSQSTAPFIECHAPAPRRDPVFPEWVVQLVADYETAWNEYSAELVASCTADRICTSESDGRQRDGFPLPCLPLDIEVSTFPNCSLGGVGLCETTVRLANLAIGVLNVLAGHWCTLSRLGRSAPQRQSQGMCLAKASRMLERLAKTTRPPPANRAWAELIDDKVALGVSTKLDRLIAADCDLLDQSGAVDALDSVP